MILDPILLGVILAGGHGNGKQIVGGGIGGSKGNGTVKPGQGEMVDGGVPSAPNRTLPYGYTKNADGSYTGPNGGIARDTGHVDANGNMILRRDSGGYYTVDTKGTQVSVSSPYTTGAPPIHHVCTNKNCTGTASGGPWTPRFQELFENAGLNINSEINKIAVPGHRGPHPAAYHQYMFRELSDATTGLTPNTPAYTNAVAGTLNRIKVEATTPGNQVNSWLTEK